MYGTKMQIDSRKTFQDIAQKLGSLAGLADRETGGLGQNLRQSSTWVYMAELYMGKYGQSSTWVNMDRALHG